MKFVEGQRLDKFIETVESVQDRLRLFSRICDAVAFAHARDVLHRDLKPANIMVGPFGEVLVMDWGLAKILRSDMPKSATASDPEATIVEKRKQSSDDARDSTRSTVITGHGTVMGTPGYMSPEQERGEIGRLDARSDIFSLGALLRFMLTQQAPAGTSPKLDRSLEAICAKAAAVQRETRYSTVQELGLDVSRYLDGLAVGAHRESIFDKISRFYRRYRFFILLILAYLLMRVILLLVLKR
jgi:serine/threonine protein kinase